MQIEKWSHILILLAALILLIYLRGRESAKPWMDTPVAYGVSVDTKEAVPALEADWLLPPYPDVANFKMPPPATKEKADPLFFATKKTFSVKSLSSVREKAIFSDSIAAIITKESMESVRVEPAAMPAAEVKTNAAEVKTPQSDTTPEAIHSTETGDKSNDEVHREVVQMIKSYLDERQAIAQIESRPAVLASAQGISGRGVTTMQARRATSSGPRYIVGVDVGVLRPQTRITPNPRMSMLSELYLGYEFSRLLQMGVCIGYTGISWPSGAQNSPKALYGTHLQAKLFGPTVMRIRPFVQAGVGGQLHAIRAGSDTTAAVPVTSYLTRSLSMGIGAECRVISRVAVQVVAEYRWNNGPLNKSLQPQQKDQYWQVKAGLSFNLGGGSKALDKGSSGGTPPGSVANM